MRSSILRHKHKDYVDVRPLLHIPMMVLSLVITLVLSLVILSPLLLISDVEVPQDQGLTTTISYISTIVICSVLAYISSVPSLLLGLMSTMDSPKYMVKDVPVLIWRNKERFIRGIIKSLTISAVLVAAYWLMIQRVPIELPAIGVWLWNVLIATRFALVDSYRVFRDDVTVLDSFGFLTPRGVASKITEKNTKIKKRWSPSFMSFGDGVLFSPFLQCLVLCGVALIIVSIYDGNIFASNLWSIAYLTCQALALNMWSIGFRLVDAYKPWGEKGKLSLMRDGYGNKLVRDSEGAKTA